MPTRSRSESVVDDLYTTFLSTPWWIPILAAGGFGLVAGLVWYAAFHVIESSGAAHADAAPANNARIVGFSVGGFVLFIGLLAQAGKLYRRGLPGRYRTLDTIRAMPWRTFEYLCAEAYRQRGYDVRERGGAAPDGGVDLEARGNGETLLIQCKRYRSSSKVGVDRVRSLLGAVTHEGASRGVLVCSGSFTQAALQLGHDPRIELVDGSHLVDWLGGKDIVEGATAGALTVVEPPGMVSPACPRCGAEMVRRSARRGAHRGSVFWGCPRFPSCRGTRPA